MISNRTAPGANAIIGFHLPSEPYGEFSNWHYSRFNLAGRHYCNAEQYMMSRKVLLAGRTDLDEKIMSTSNPSQIKEYGGPKYFTDFDKIKDIWDKTARSVVKTGLRAKFKQNPELLDRLLGTGDALLAECAGHDVIWGIGINLHDKSWHDVSNWHGRNQLGIVLMELREELRNEIAFRGGVKDFNFEDAHPIDVWQMQAGQLKRIPQYYDAIHAYAEQLPAGAKRDRFYFLRSLAEWDETFREESNDGLPITGFYEMKQDIYEIYRSLSHKHFVSDIFIEKPRQWGLRGDSYFWDYLADHFTFTELPFSVGQLVDVIRKEYRDKTGEELTEGSCRYVEEFAHGGMSSGSLWGEFWLRTAIPLLSERLRGLQQRF